MINLLIVSLKRPVRLILGWGIFLLVAHQTSGQELPFDPMSCGYSCSANDVIISEPYLSSDLSGTPITSCDGTSGEVFTAYISFTLQNSTGSLRYTPMIQANLNNGGNVSQFNSCFSDLPANTSATYTLPVLYTFTCGAEVNLENIWIGWNVSPTDCGDVANAKGCNQLIPSGKCGDYNSIPIYVKMSVDTPTELGEENTASRCSDGVDNDGDGIIDCDESSCAQFDTCTYTETSSGNDGGLESNSRLIEKIAQRQYNRSISGKVRLPLIRPGNSLKQFVYRKRRPKRNARYIEDISLASLLPEGNTIQCEGYVSSPEDLSTITNAQESFAVDYFEGTQRKAAILATRTPSGVYEHTKVICDRVDGTRLSGIWKAKMGDTPPIMVAKLERPNGDVEYASSFSIRSDESNASIIEQYWNVSEYSSSASYINIQIWASNPLQLEKLFVDLTTKLEAFREVPTTFQTGALPEIYVINQRYTNQVLEVEIANPKGYKQVKVYGVERLTESGAEQSFAWNLSLSGDPVEVIRMETGGIYSVGLSFQSESGNPDTIFFADGAWGLDIDPNHQGLNFTVFNEESLDYPDDWNLERGVILEGNLDYPVAWYRALKNTFQDVSLDDFEGFAFRSESDQPITLEVVLSRSNIPWEELPRKMINVRAGIQEHYIDLEDWLGGKQSQAHMLVFRISNTDQEVEDFRIQLDQLRFTNNPPAEILTAEKIGLKQKELRIFPNPARDYTELIFDTKISGDVSWSIFNPKEHKNSGVFQANQGVNRKTLDLNGYLPGLYWVELNLPDGQTIRTKFVIY